jgi:hypothetical protein
VIQPVTEQIAGIAAHPQDDLILATTLTAQAPDLVTGDQPLLQRGAYCGTRHHFNPQNLLRGERPQRLGAS